MYCEHVVNALRRYVMEHGTKCLLFTAHSLALVVILSYGRRLESNRRGVCRMPSCPCPAHKLPLCFHFFFGFQPAFTFYTNFPSFSLCSDHLSREESLVFCVECRCASVPKRLFCREAQGDILFPEQFFFRRAAHVVRYAVRRKEYAPGAVL